MFIFTEPPPLHALPKMLCKIFSHPSAVHLFLCCTQGVSSQSTQRLELQFNSLLKNSLPGFASLGTDVRCFRFGRGCKFEVSGFRKLFFRPTHPTFRFPMPDPPTLLSTFRTVKTLRRSKLSKSSKKGQEGQKCLQNSSKMVSNGWKFILAVQG